jgi:Flp pilus assembly protein TadD
LGNANQLTSNWDDAHRAYTFARNLSPDDPRIYNNLGAVFFQRKQFNQAEAAYLRALKLSPSSPASYGGSTRPKKPK